MLSILVITHINYAESLISSPLKLLKSSLFKHKYCSKCIKTTCANKLCNTNSIFQPQQSVVLPSSNTDIESVNEQRQPPLWTLPNILTLFRIGALPFFVASFMYKKVCIIYIHVCSYIYIYNVIITHMYLNNVIEISRSFDILLVKYH